MGFHQLYQHMRNGSPRRRAKERDRKSIKETVGEMLPNVLKSINLHIGETQCTSSRINPKQSTFRHIIIKFTKVRDNDKL